MKQARLGLNLSTKRTRMREFLDDMERVVPWSSLVSIVEPHCPRSKTGRPPFAVETMLRINYLQQWFGLSDPAMEEALHDVPLYREFAGLDAGADRLTDESTIVRFRQLLERHHLAVDMLRLVNDILQAKGVKAWAESFAGSLSGAEPKADHAAPLKRNPDWNRDELIMALDLYLRNRSSPPGKDFADVIELSDFLNRIATALRKGASETFRNANGVYMKMMNFRRFDPAYTSDGKVGLTRGNQDEETVWNEFSGDPDRLAGVVNAIRLAIEQHGEDVDLAGDDEPDIHEAAEGRVLTRLHRVRERSRKLVAAAKEAALKKYGRLQCAACGFDFSVKYGPIADGLIDVHHTKPIHTLVAGDTTKVHDLALLCANCHRVVHSSRRWLTVEQVRLSIRE